jgi:hypothetical protein
VARVDRPPPVWGVVAAVGVLFVNWIVDASILQQHRLGRCRLFGRRRLGVVLLCEAIDRQPFCRGLSIV